MIAKWLSFYVQLSQLFSIHKSSKVIIIRICNSSNIYGQTADADTDNTVSSSTTTIHCKAGSKTPVYHNQVEDKERMKPGHLLKSGLHASFSAVTLLSGKTPGQQKHHVPLISKGFLLEKGEIKEVKGKNG